MKKFLACFFLLLASSHVFAREIDVDLKADRLKYIEGTSIIEASGSVEVRLEEMVIRADSIRMDSESNIVTAEGNVRMLNLKYEARSDRAVYDPDRDRTSFSNFRTVINPEKLKGELFLSACDLSDEKDRMEGAAGGLTTCGDKTPHFTLAAERIEYYPDDKIIGYNAVFFVGKMPAFWMPYLYYDLKQKHKRNWEIGHNQVEGDFFKSTWDYPYGLLYLDLMQKKGFGHGIENDYALGALGVGSFFLYHLDEQDTGKTDWITRIDHTKALDPWTNLNLKHNYTATYLIPSGRRDQTSFGLGMEHNHEARWGMSLATLDDRIAGQGKYSGSFNQAYQNISSDYSFNYEFSKNDPQWIRSSQRLTHRRPLFSDNVMLNTRINYHNNVASKGAPGDERLEPEIELSGRGSGYTWTARRNWYIDLDRDLYTDDNTYQYLEREPEITVMPDPLDLDLFILRPLVGYGSFHEVRYVSELGRNRDFTTRRYQATLNASRSIPLNFGTVAILGAGIDQFIYATDDQLFAYREDLSLRTDLYGFFRNNITYKKGLTEGNTPFLFDRLGTQYHNLQEEVAFSYLDRASWTTSGGYNWQTEKWFDVMSRLSFSPTDKMNWELRTGWDIENRLYKDLINRVRLFPASYFSTELSTTSDMNIGALRTGSVLYDLYMLEGEPNQWHLKLSQVFDPASQEFKLRDIMVAKDLHCWEMTFTYSDYRKEFSFSFSLKAMPDEPFGISSGRGFYFDGFDKEINAIKGGGNVQRY